MSPRRRVALGWALVIGTVLVGLSVHAALGRRGPTPLEIVLVEATGSGDLALSSGTRWLRHPSVSEPAAGCIGPTCLDTDPAGMAIPRRAPVEGAVVIARVPEGG